jgi:uncharacterized protein
MKTNVTFDSAGLKIAGHLFTPDDGATGPRSAIVVGGPGSSVKEQAAGLYAQRLAGQGFVTLAAEARGEGVQTFRLFPDTAEEEQYVAPAIAKLSEFYAANLAERAVA